MAIPRPKRPPLVIALQTEATLLMSVAIGQAGFAAAFIGGQKGYKAVHAINAWLVVAATVVLLVTAVVYARRGGPRWPAAASLGLLVVEAVQITLGEVELVAVHVFLGVLFVSMATALTSYLFRLSFRRRPA